MKLIITGALGHIGSFLIRNLKTNKKIKEIVLIDNFSSERYCSLYDLKNNNYKFVNLDLANENIKYKNADVIIHLAAKTNAAQSSKHHKEFYSNNFKATKNVVDYCIKNNAKLIFASTTSVYGPQKNIVDESCSKKDLNPQSPYALTKLKEENYINKNFSKLPNFFSILRFGTVYGFSEGMRFHTAVNKFCLQASMKIPITVWKTAYNQNRPYLGLDDLSKSLCHIIDNNLFNNDTYNIVTKNMSVKEVISFIKNKTTVKLSFVDHEIMNQLSYNVLSDKFQSTGFKFNSNISKSITEILLKLKYIN